MAATRIDGSWGQAVEIALPAGAASSGQKARFGFPAPSVACTEPGDCAAVGSYIKEDGEQSGDGRDRDGRGVGHGERDRAAGKRGRQPGTRPCLGCLSSGRVVCSPRRVHRRTSGDEEAMVADETDGAWGPASEIELPANAESNSRSYLDGVACSAAGSCVGIGEYWDGSTKTKEAMVVTETDGKWAQASQIALPENAGKPSPNQGLIRWCVSRRGRASPMAATSTAPMTGRRWSPKRRTVSGGRRARSRRPRTSQPTRKSGSDWPLCRSRVPPRARASSPLSTPTTPRARRRWSPIRRTGCGGRRARSPRPRTPHAIRKHRARSSLSRVGGVRARRRVHRRRR